MSGKYILKISLIIAIPLVLFLAVNQIFVNTYDGKPCVSYSLETSHKNKLYLGLYKPTSDSIQLKNRKIKAVDAWAESRWRDGHFLLFFSTIKKENGLNVIVPYMWDDKEYPDFFMEMLDGKNNGNNPGLGFVYYFTYQPETLSLIIQQQKNDSWEETINTDTITYKKAF